MTVVTRVFLDVGALFPGGAWGPEMPTETVSRVKVADGRLVTLEASVRLRGSGSALLEAFGRVAGDKLNLTVRTAGQETRRTLPFEPDYLVDSVGAPFTGMPQLSVGRRWTVRGFNPISGSVSNVTAEVTRRERLTWQNEDLECHVVEIGETPFRSTAWVDDMGRTLRYDLMGFTFLLERPKAGPTEDRDDRNREPDTEVRREDGR
jgi:hypothetical protein